MFLKFLGVSLLLFSTLFASVHDKSAMVYYGKNISYPMVGVADYIIIQSDNINTNSHGFSVYKDKMYAYISIGEIDSKIKEYAYIQKDWVLTINEAWNSEVLDIKNLDYQKFLFEVMIEPRMKLGYKNFFFDTLDSYQLASKTPQDRADNEKALAAFINKFHNKYPDSKLIINRGFEIIDAVYESVEAVLFESYYTGLGGENLAYKDVSDTDRIWLDMHLNKIKAYGLDIISVEYLEISEMHRAKEISQKIVAKGMIPYISNRELNFYGYSSKNAIKREVFTLIDEKKLDRIYTKAHRYGALPLEYMGYIQKLYDINSGLPSMDKMHHYAGVVIWLHDNYAHPKKLIKWVKNLEKIGIKVVFIDTFGIKKPKDFLEPLGIKAIKKLSVKSKILHQDKMLGFEINPSLAVSAMQVESKNIKPLLVYEYRDKTKSTPAAITSWGAYAVDSTYQLDINGDVIYIMNPFEFLTEALRLQSLIVPDPSTQNGKRLFFTHIDGDGIMNRVEGASHRFSGEVILDEILKVYKTPHSVSVIGGEIDANGLYPELSEKLTSIAIDMYKLEYVESATHTFSHPYFWGKIKNNSLSPKYRLKVKNYDFSLERELSQSIEEINSNLKPINKAKTVFWSGNCAPREDALEHIYKNNILNINGGDTTITKTNPWLPAVASLGLERGDYYQVYTGAQNENVYTNDWLGPFWGFKRVVETYKLTNSPRRLKPIDIYYHLYSGSKRASTEALTYVFDWAMKQETMPIFTSEYIPKVLDYYTAGLVQEDDEWLVTGMKDLKTIRIEKKNAYIDLNNSKSSLGIKHFETHTYVSLDNTSEHIIRMSQKKQTQNSYLVSANARVTNYINRGTNKYFSFDGHVDLKLEFSLASGCSIRSKPEASKVVKNGTITEFLFKQNSSALVEIECQE